MTEPVPSGKRKGRPPVYFQGGRHAEHGGGGKHQHGFLTQPDRRADDSGAGESGKAQAGFDDQPKRQLAHGAYGIIYLIHYL
ncbi:MAG: hypothetical protein M3N50_13680 [Pseudomonadota bacterium]|nr:hypothetical protein [Pseudomonadota bacterium]